jgi:hypothetical protein
MVKIMLYGQTSYNRTACASPPVGGSGFRSARSFRAPATQGTLHFHASLHPHFCSPGLCFAKPLFGPPKRRRTEGSQTEGLQTAGTLYAFLLNFQITIIIAVDKICINRLFFQRISIIILRSEL